MKKLFHFIAKISTKKNIKTMLMIFVVLGLFVGLVVAQDNSIVPPEATSDVQGKVSRVIYILTALLSRGRIILANLAGKFMTNDFLYGTFLNLDASLWTLWQIMRNFANFALGFLFLFYIVRNLFLSAKSGDAGDKSPLSILKKMIFAGVLVNMSRFLVGAVVDVSTIATMAIGSLPAQFINSNDMMQQNLRGLINGVQTMKINFGSTNEMVSVESSDEIVSEDDIVEFIDTILPSESSVSGPLIFIGMSVFDLYQLGDISKQANVATERSDLLLSLGINAIVLFSFSLMMAMIFLFNLFRMLTLWVVIPLIPLIVVLRAFASAFGKDKSDFFSSTGLAGLSNVGNILKLIFKPVIMVGCLSIVLVVLVLVRSVIKSTGTINVGNDDGVVVQGTNIGEDRYNSSLGIKGILNFQLNGLKCTIADLLVYVLGLCLIYFIMKMSISGGIGVKFLDDKLKKWSDNIFGDRGLLMSLPVIPIGGGKGVGIGTIKRNLESAHENALANLAFGTQNVIDQDSRTKTLLGLDSLGSFDLLKSNIKNYPTKDNFLEVATSVGGNRKFAHLDYNDKQGLFQAIIAWNKEHQSKTGSSIGTRDYDDYIDNKQQKDLSTDEEKPS